MGLLASLLILALVILVAPPNLRLWIAALVILIAVALKGNLIAPRITALADTLWGKQ